MPHRPKIAIVMSTTRPGRFCETPTQWLSGLARERTDAEFSVIDLRDFPMPFFEEKLALVYAPATNEIARNFAAAMEAFDGYVFITAEYNHSVPGVLKNAIDYLYTELHRKPAAFVGYGGVGGSRSVEHLRHILAELQMATLKHSVHITAVEMLGILREGKTLAQYPYLAETAHLMLEELVWWAETLRNGRQSGVREAETLDNVSDHESA